MNIKITVEATLVAKVPNFLLPPYDNDIMSRDCVMYDNDVIQLHLMSI